MQSVYVSLPEADNTDMAENMGDRPDILVMRKLVSLLNGAESFYNSNQIIQKAYEF
jgi:hypothetical protein